MPSFARDRPCGIGMVSSDHDDADTRSPAARDRVPRLGPRRVLQADEAEKRQPLLDVVVGRGRICGRFLELPLGERQHTERVVGQQGASHVDACSLGIRHRHDPGRRPDVAAAREDDLGSPFHERPRLSFERANDGHALAVRVERDAAQARHVDVELLRRDATLRGHDEERALGRVADNPGAALARVEDGVVAGRRGTQETEQRLVGHRRYLGVVAEEDTVGRVSLARHAEHAFGGNHLARRHLTDGESPGLVGADHLRTAERLDRGQASDERVTSHHARDAERQRNRDDRGETFGDCRDGEAHGREEELEGRQPACDAEDEHQHDDRRACPEQAAGDLVEAPLERRVAARRRLEQAGDATDLGLHAGGDDDGPPGPARHAGAEEHHAAAVGERCLDAAHRGVLLDRFGLAGQRCLVGPQHGRVNQPRIGRNQISRVDEEQVAAYDVTTRDDFCPSVADYSRTRCGHSRERGDRLLGAVLLEEPDDGVEDDDGDDRAAVDDLAESNRDPGGADQNPHHQALELSCEDREPRRALGLAQLVRSVRDQPRPRRIPRKPVR